MRASLIARRRMAAATVKNHPVANAVRKTFQGSPILLKPLTFREFVDLVAPSFVWYDHCVRLANVLQRVADGEIRRLLIFMPPRHGKSELVSRLFTAYCVYRYPHEWVGLASYSADLAEDLSDNARDNYRTAGGKVKRSSASKKMWKTWAGGGMWASGVGGAMTGKGFRFGIIDDPLKNADEANSATIRAKQKDWYRSTFYTRGAPNEAIIILMTRWHDDDLAGWQILEEFEAAKGDDGMPENWHVVNYEAVRDFDTDTKWPSTCTVERDPRNHGEALCPERYPVSKLRRLAKRLGEYFFNALYQQRPIPAGGGIFKLAWFKYRLHVSQIPAMRRIVIGVDLAASEKDSADYTVAFPLGVDKDGRYYLFRPYRAQAESPEANAGIATRALEVKSRTVAVEGVALGWGLISHLRKRPEMVGRAVIGVAADRDKEVRARGWSPIAEQGLITLVQDGTGWEEEFLAEAKTFPRSKHDDQIDAVGIAFAGLADSGDFAAAAGGTGTGDVRKGLR